MKKTTPRLTFLKQISTDTKNMLGLGFIALFGLATLFIINGMVETTGNFVYAAGRVQLDITEACNQVKTCQSGPAVFVSSTGWKYNMHPGQYALCVCPEDVYSWQKEKPLVYDNSKVRIIPFVQNYEIFLEKNQGGAQFGEE